MKKVYLARIQLIDAGADPARGGHNSEHFLSNLKKLIKRVKFFLTTQSLIVKETEFAQTNL